MMWVNVWGKGEGAEGELEIRLTLLLPDCVLRFCCVHVCHLQVHFIVVRHLRYGKWGREVGKSEKDWRISARSCYVHSFVFCVGAMIRKVVRKGGRRLT